MEVNKNLLAIDKKELYIPFSYIPYSALFASSLHDKEIDTLCKLRQVFLLSTVKGKELGRVMWLHRNSKAGYEVNLVEPHDTTEKDFLKKMIQNMICLESENRLRIQKVVEKLLKLQKHLHESRVLAVMACSEKSLSVWEYRGTSGWKERCPLSKARTREAVCVCGVSDGLVVLGGTYGVWSSAPAIATCYHYSIAMKKWRKLLNMPTPRSRASAALLADDVVMVIGGATDHEPTTRCEKLSVKENIWYSVKDMQEALCNPLVASAAGQVFILPQEELEHSRARFDLLQYDPVKDDYRHPDNSGVKVSSTEGASMVGVMDHVYILGGHKRLSLMYSLATEQWTEVLGTSLRYQDGCCAVAGYGTILLCGGQGYAHMERDMVEEYDVIEKDWVELPTCLPFQYHRYHTTVVSCRE